MNRLALLLLAFSVTGCATLASMYRSDPEKQLDLGVTALLAQQYSEARTLLEPLFRERLDEETGQRAGVLLIAAELDNRNPQRRLWAAADMAARLLSAHDLESWLVPVGESYYLLALELGAQEQRLARADSARAAAEEVMAEASRALPSFGLESVPARINRITAERDELRRRVSELNAAKDSIDTELRTTRQELERVRQTIRH